MRNLFHLKLAMLAAGALAIGSLAPAQSGAQSEIGRSMGITQRLGETVPGDIPFKDEEGRDVKFGDYLNRRPLLVVPIFYRCETGCSVITDAVMKTLAKGAAVGNLAVGRQLDVVMVSIHPKETPELAANKKALIVRTLANPDKNLPEPVIRDNWHLLTGDYDNIRRLTDALGFKFYYNEAKDIIRHPTMTAIVAPTGKITGYTIGNTVPTKVLLEDVQLAAKNEVGLKVDQTFLFGCVQIDPATGKASIVIEQVVRLAGLITLIVLVTAIVRMSIKYRHSDNAPTDLSGGNPGG